MSHRRTRRAALLGLVLVMVAVSGCESNAAKMTTGTTPSPKGSAMVAGHARLAS